jgi:glutathione S-transferase
MPTYRLTYFDAAGRAEPIRIAFHIAGIPFEDRRVKFPEFGELKQQGALPLGSVPLLEVDGAPIVQTAAILRFVARLSDTGLYPADPMRALLVDSALDSMNDTLSHSLTPSLFERDPAKKLAMREAWASGPMTSVLSYIEGLLERFGGPFLGGEAMSIADLVVAQQALQIRSGALDGITSEMLAPYTRIAALTDAYLADPRIAAYSSRRAA